KVMIVYGGGSVVKSGLLARVEKSLKEAGIEFVELGGVKPNPVDTKVYEGIELARKENVDFMLPVGGGSVIDTAKSIAVGVCYDGDFWDFYEGKAEIKAALKVGVVLTIPAAGSEGSGNAVITNKDLKKFGIRAPKLLRPVFAIMNPELTMTLPAWQTASGVVDMMVHIFERYFTNTKNVSISDRLCEGILLSIIEEAPKVMANPNDYDARANIMWAGTVAHNGTCGVGREEEWTSHQMEHEISALYDVTHGAGLAVVFPAWATYMAKHHPAYVYQMATRIFGVPEGDDKTAVALQGVERLKKFWKSIGMPLTFKELGVENPDIDLLVKNLHRNKGEEFGFYVKVNPAISREIYEYCI
ncbi:MAG: iron-containing alcohol dehydrogenase, partial [Bacteroidaceae bacterium]|nr:iron-containing alcohol dehydrogenase [Bacteroidaceae bacterium]